MTDPAPAQPSTPSVPPAPHVPAGPPPFSFGSFVVGLTVGVVAGLFGGAVVVPLLEPMVRSGGGGVVTSESGTVPGTKVKPLTPEELARELERRRAAEPSAGSPVGDPGTPGAVDPAKAEPAKAEPTKPEPTAPEPKKPG